MKSLLQALDGVISTGADGPQDDAKTPDLREVSMNNTIAAMTRAPEKKREWWEDLRKLATHARQQEQSDLDAYVAALLRLLEGTNPADFTATIPAAFRPDWQAILDGISKKE